MGFGEFCSFGGEMSELLLIENGPTAQYLLSIIHIALQ